MLRVCDPKLRDRSVTPCLCDLFTSSLRRLAVFIFLKISPWLRNHALSSTVYVIYVILKVGQMIHSGFVSLKFPAPKGKFEFVLLPRNEFTPIKLRFDQLHSISIVLLYFHRGETLSDSLYVLQEVEEATEDATIRHFKQILRLFRRMLQLLWMMCI